jgi:hypothetical protein
LKVALLNFNFNAGLSFVVFVAQTSVAAEELATSHSGGWVRPRNPLFLGFGEERQITRFARDDKNAIYPQPVQRAGFRPNKD